jgi:hypothetical protein
MARASDYRLVAGSGSLACRMITAFMAVAVMVAARRGAVLLVVGTARPEHHDFIRRASLAHRRRVTLATLWNRNRWHRLLGADHHQRRGIRVERWRPGYVAIAG